MTESESDEELGIKEPLGFQFSKLKSGLMYKMVDELELENEEAKELISSIVQEENKGSEGIRLIKQQSQGLSQLTIEE